MPVITGTNGNDNIIGTAGDDTISPLWGSDIVDGLGGSDTLIVDYTGSLLDPFGGAAVPDLRSVVTSVGGSFSGKIANGISVTFSNIEHLQVTLDVWGTPFVLDGAALALGATISLDGGAGNDTLEADLSALASVNFQVGPGGTTASFGTIVNFETFKFNLTAGADTVTTGSGRDTLIGNGGDDVLNSGAGNDILSGGSGSNTLNGGDGDDQISSTGIDTVDGGAGFDNWSGDFSSSNANFSMVRDRAAGTATLSNGTTLAGIEVITALTTGAGNDVFVFNESESTSISAGAGDDSLTLTGSAFSGDLSVDAIGGFKGWFGLDRFTSIEHLHLTSGAAADFVSVDAAPLLSGATLFLDASGGSDTLAIDLSSLGAISFVVAADGSLTTNVPATLLNFENYRITTGGAADNIVTRAGDDIVHAGAGNDVIDTGAGNDLLDGASGADLMTGGTGDDIYLIDDAGDTVTEAAAEGIDEIRTYLASFSLAALANVENLTGTSLTGQTLTGNALVNQITGAAGDDHLAGMGAGDVLQGMAGNDTYLIDDATTTVVESPGQGFDTVNTTVSYVLTNFSEIEVLSVSDRTTTNAIDLTGSQSSQSIYGNAGTNMLNGGGGSDSLYGLGGDDTYVVDGFDDRVIEATGAGIDTVRSRGNYALAAGSEVENLVADFPAGTFGLSLGGNEFAQTIRGTAGDDYLYGGGGNDLLQGGEGNDSLEGDDGADTIEGNAGDDAIYVDSNDVVIDGGSGDDLLVFDGRGGVAQGVTFDLSDPSIEQTLNGVTIRNVEILHYGGSSGADHVSGGANQDILVGAEGDDILSGGGGDDWLEGNEGLDQLFGGDGDDVLVSWAQGAGDLLDGGGGFDFLQLNLEGYSGNTTIDLGDSSGSIRNIEKITFVGGAGINIVTGGGAVDDMSGNNSADEFRGLGGDDGLGGGGGDDRLYGGDGNDYIDGGAGADAIYGEAGDDNLFDGGNDASFIDGGAGNDAIQGGLGNDTLIGGEGNDFIDGSVGADSMSGGIGDDIYVIDDTGDVAIELAGEGKDTIRTSLASFSLATLANVENLTGTSLTAQALTGNALDNAIFGGGGNDTLVGGLGADTMSGRLGNDLYFVDNAGDLVIEGAGQGNDRIFAGVSYALAAGQQIEMLTTDFNGGTNAINLTGNVLSQAIYGNEGANVLDGGGGGDTLVGFGGNDFYYVRSPTDRVIESAGGGSDRIFAAVSFKLEAGSQVEMITTDFNGGSGAINLTGNALSQGIYGNEGANILDGGGGGDTLVGFGGNDFYYIRSAADRVIESGGGGNDRIFSALSFTLEAGSQVEMLTTDFNGGTNAINLTGNALSQGIYGNEGANILDGGGGGDTLVGFGGDDFYYIRSATDRVIESAGGGNDRVFAAVSFTLEAGSQVEMLTTDFNGGTNAINLTGNALSQGIYGNAGANALDGGGGGDTLVGFGGDDLYYVHNSADRVVESAGGGNDRIFASVSFTLEAGSQVEMITTDFNPGTSAINLTGNELANSIYGNAGANIIDGKGGSDGLVGFGGADTFAFTTALGAGNVDTIVDFTSGTDKIALDDAVFTGIGGLGALNAGAFVAGTAAGDADDRIIYDSVTGNLFFDADGNGAGAAVLFANLSSHPIISASDFQVI